MEQSTLKIGVETPKKGGQRPPLKYKIQRTPGNKAVARASKSGTVEIKSFGDSVEVRGVPGMLSMGRHGAEASPVIHRCL